MMQISFLSSLLGTVSGQNQSQTSGEGAPPSAFAQMLAADKEALVVPAIPGSPAVAALVQPGVAAQPAAATQSTAALLQPAPASQPAAVLLPGAPAAQPVAELLPSAPVAQPTVALLQAGTSAQLFQPVAPQGAQPKAATVLATPTLPRGNAAAETAPAPELPAAPAVTLPGQMFGVKKLVPVPVQTLVPEQAVPLAQAPVAQQLSPVVAQETNSDQPTAAPLDGLEQISLQAELAKALAPAAAAPAEKRQPAAAHVAQSALAASGKTATQPGKILPVVAGALPDALPEALIADVDTAADGETFSTVAPQVDPQAQDLPAFIDAALSQPSPLAALAVAVQPQGGQPVPAPAAELAQPLAQGQLAAAMQERPLQERQAIKPRAAEAAQVQPLADDGSIDTPVAEFSIPLGRSAQPGALRAADPMPAMQASNQDAAFAQFVATPSADQIDKTSDTIANAGTVQSDAPAEVELGPVIDKLVMTRMQGREGRSELNVPHPDFGRVTLGLSLAGNDRLGLTIPDAPNELRVAIGQAFGPAPVRNEGTAAVTSSDGNMTGGSDARPNEQRRDSQSAGGQQRNDWRPGTGAGREGEQQGSRARSRNSEGRGTLA